MLSDLMQQHFAEEDGGKPAPVWRPKVNAVINLMDTLEKTKGQGEGDGDDAFWKGQGKKTEYQGDGDEDDAFVAMKSAIEDIIKLLDNDVKAMNRSYEYAVETLQERGKSGNSSFTRTEASFRKVSADALDISEKRTQYAAMVDQWGSPIRDELGGSHSCQSIDCSPEAISSCGTNDTFQYQLTADARAVHKCDFRNPGKGDTVDSCYHTLSDEVLVTKEAVKQMYEPWLKAKNMCEAEKKLCLEPCADRKSAMSQQTILISSKRDDLQSSYCNLNEHLAQYCSAVKDLAKDVSRLTEEERLRKAEWKDLMMVKCIFNDAFGKYTHEAGKNVNVKHFTTSFKTCQSLTHTDDDYNDAIGGHIAPPTIASRDDGEDNIPHCTSGTQPAFGNSDTTGLVLSEMTVINEEHAVKWDLELGISSTDGNLSPAEVLPPFDGSGCDSSPR